MSQGDSLKSYISYFWSQLVKVLNCSEDVSTLAFISRLQISYPCISTYKSMMSRGWVKFLSRAHPYIQLKEVMKSSVNHSLKRNNDGEKMNSQCETLTHAGSQNQGQLTFKRQALRFSPQVRSKPTSRQSTSLRWGSPSSRSSTQSRTNYGSGVRNQSSTI